MRKLELFLVIAVNFIYCTKAFSQPSPQYDLINQDEMHNLHHQKADIGSIRRSSDFSKNGHQVNSYSHINNVYELSTKLPLIDKIPSADETLLLEFEAKSVKSSQETDEARAMFVLNYNKEKSTRIEQAVSMSTEWKKYYFILNPKGKITPEEFYLVLQYGYPTQEFYIKNIHLWVYDKDVEPSALPKTQIKYAGMEANAIWRQSAFERIEKFRKGQITLHLTLDGKSIDTTTAKINLVKHQFGWGVGIRAIDAEKNPALLDTISRHFNLVVFLNDLKMKFWGKQVTEQSMISILKACQKKNISVKGHVLVWPGYNHLPAIYKENKSNPEKITQMVTDHLDNILSKTDGLIDRWDVINEAYTNKDLQHITGSNTIFYDIFNKVRKDYPHFRRYINDYGIINKAGTNIEKQKWYFNFINEINAKTENAIDGIGIQAHFGTDLTPPEKVLQILNLYAPLNKTISISEYTLDISDPAIRQMYTEDLLIAAFSHPQVNEFLFWGFQGSSTDKVDIYNKNWQIGSMGKAYFNLVEKMWTTNMSCPAEDSHASFQGFFGQYNIHVTIGNKVYIGDFNFLPENRNAVIEVNLKPSN